MKSEGVAALLAALRRGAALAPMAGVTDSPFRVLCLQQGCAYVTTEMVSAKGFLYAKEESRVYRGLLGASPEEHGHVALQLFGHEPEIVARAAERLTREGPYALLDLNMGCPMPKIVGNGDGSALLRDPALAKEVIAAAVEAAHVPVSVKLRTGFERGQETCCALGRMAEEAGASLLTLHARSREQYYEGRADWRAIRRLKESVGIPVIGNGDVASGQDALRMLEETGCDGVAVGRAAQGNPWLFRQIAAALQGAEAPAVSGEEKLAVLLRHLMLLIAWKGEAIAVREMRRHASAYISGMRNAAEMRQVIQGLQTPEAFERALTRFLLDGIIIKEETT